MTPVEVGQLWIDNDRRTPAWAGALRYILVRSIDGEKATCVTWIDIPEGVSQARPSTISLRRFKPTSTGYRLADGSGHAPMPKHGRPV